MEKLFKKYLNGTCTPQEFDTVIDMLCDKNKESKLSADIYNLWKECMNLEDNFRINDQLLLKVHNKIALEESIKNHKRFTTIANILKVAAIIIIGLMISTVIFYYKSTHIIKGELVQKISTPFGAKTNFTLPDGTDVWLNSGSVLSYSTKINREVNLSGQAFFVISINKRPFTVNTSYGTVEAKGTTFDVKAYNNDDFQTTLVEGNIEIHNKLDEIIKLKPNQQLTIDTLNKFKIKNVETNLFTSWKDGRLIFLNEPFHKVAREMERWYNVKIEIQGDQLKNLKYTGKIEMETFSEVLNLINITTHIKYKFDKKTRILTIYSNN